MPFSFFAFAYLTPHISINIVEFSCPPALGRGTATGTDNLDATQPAPRSIERQQPRFLVNLVEVAGCSTNISLTKGRILWPE